jgi:hypothetical protein
MSAALQLPMVWGASGPSNVWVVIKKGEEERRTVQLQERAEADSPATNPPIGLAFYRRHTEKLLRRYLYASMQVGRAPSILSDAVGRGWASSRPVRTFEDAVIFVLDMETCLDRMGALERTLLSRIVLQDYTQSETAALLGMSIRAVTYSFPLALDRLTEMLLRSKLLVIPKS